MSNELFAKWKKMGIKTQEEPAKSEENKVAFVPTRFINPPTAKPVEKRKTGTDEMKDIMAKKDLQAPTFSAKEQFKKKTYLDEMKEIMGKKSEGFQQPVKNEIMRKTYLDEMKQIMANKDTMQEVPKVELPPKRAYLEDTQEAAFTGNKEAPAVVEKIINVDSKKIEEDEEMNDLKEMLEARIKFSQGDTLELKPKPEPVNEEMPSYQPEVQMAEQVEASYQPEVESHQYNEEGNGTQESVPYEAPPVHQEEYVQENSEEQQEEYQQENEPQPNEEHQTIEEPYEEYQEVQNELQNEEQHEELQIEASKQTTYQEESGSEENNYDYEKN